MTEPIALQDEKPNADPAARSGPQVLLTASSQIHPTTNSILGDIANAFADPADRKKDPSEKPRDVVSRMRFENQLGKIHLAHLYSRHAKSQPPEREFVEGDHEDKSHPGEAGGIEPQIQPVDGWWRRFWSRDTSPSKPDTIFIESGSTVLYVSNAIRWLFNVDRTAERDDGFPRDWTSQSRIPPLFVRTNNHLTAWLYINTKHCKHVIVPSLFAGFLEEKYHGIFPFYSGDSLRKLAGSDLENRYEEERIGYAQCRLDLARCDLSLLAASRLSLRFGPLVGSRENAIFKNATYNACVPAIGDVSSHELHLFVTVQKLIAHSTENIDCLTKKSTPDASDREAFHTFEEEVDKIEGQKCFPVFDIKFPDADRDGDLLRRRYPNSYEVRSPFTNSLCANAEEQPLKDGTSAVRMGEGRFRICRTWQELFTRGGLTLKVFVSYRKSECAAALGINERDWIRNELRYARLHCPEMRFRFYESQSGKELVPRPPGDDGFALGCIVITSATTSDEPTSD